MGANLNNISGISGATSTQIYQVSAGKSLIILAANFYSLVNADVIVFLRKQKLDSTFINLIPGKKILATNDEGYRANILDKVVLNPGEKIFIQSAPRRNIRSINLFGFPFTMIDPSQVFPAQIVQYSISFAEKDN